MKTGILRIALSLGVLALGLWLSGCGTMGSGSVSGGYGGEGGIWPQQPNRSLNTNSPAPQGNEVPTAPLLVVLRGATLEGDEMLLDLADMRLKYGDKWQGVTIRAEMVKLEPMPVKLTNKGNAYLLARVQIPKRQYTHLSFRLADEKTAIVRGEQRLPLTVQTPVVSLGEWTPDAGHTNVIELCLDGAKITTATRSATLPAEGITAEARVPAGSITGKVTPPTPTARVELFWGKTKLAAKNPDVKDGAFTFPELPAGSYRLEITAPGQRLAEPMDDKPITVAKKTVELKTFELTADTQIPQ